MKYIKLENCPFERFERIRDAYYKWAHFAMFHAGYSRKERIAVFGFWDESYIVPQLLKHISYIPSNDRLIAEIGEILK